MKFTPMKKMFKCDVCSYESNYMQNIKTHTATHHEEVLYICDICGFKHKWKVSYLAHRRQAHNIILRKIQEKEKTTVINQLSVNRILRQVLILLASIQKLIFQQFEVDRYCCRKERRISDYS